MVILWFIIIVVIDMIMDITLNNIIAVIGAFTELTYSAAARHGMPLIHIKAILTFGNLILLISLLFIYLKNYEQMKSKFALGLVAFIVLLIMHALTSNLIFYQYHKYPVIGYFSVMPDLFEFIALLILLYISLK